MMNLEDVNALPSQDYRQMWGALLTTNLNSLFELALLFTADPQMAEASLASCINSVDVSSQPDLKGLQAAVALHSIGTEGIDSPTAIKKARSMTRSTLHPILQLERFPRVCFVLRMMSGYATSTCAGMLSIDDHAVRVQVRTAILQLHHAVIAQRDSPQQV
jgi:hypothetical protein